MVAMKQYTRIEIDGHVTCDCCLMPMMPNDQKLEWYSFEGKWHAVIYWHCPVCNTQQWDHFPSHCCQTCGEAIGWIGRFHQWNGLNWLFKIHRCNPNSPRPR